MTDRRQVLTKTASTGQTITVHLDTDRDRRGVNLVAEIDGQQVGSSGKLATPRNLPPGAVASIGPACFTAEEADQLQAVLDQAWSDMPRDLRSERRMLVHALQVAEETYQEERNAAFNSGELTTFFPDREKELKAKITAAEEAVAVFDREHPEVIEGIRQRKAADAQRRIDRGD